MNRFSTNRIMLRKHTRYITMRKSEDRSENSKIRKEYGLIGLRERAMNMLLTRAKLPIAMYIQSRKWSGKPDYDRSTDYAGFITVKLDHHKRLKATPKFKEMILCLRKKI